MILTSEYTIDFYDWLEDIAKLLPPKMSVHEAKLLYERKIREEKETKMKKEVNLADKKAALELLKNLYGDKKDEYKEPDSLRELGTKSIDKVDKLPPNCS